MEPPSYGKPKGPGGSVMISLDELERIKDQVQKTHQDAYLAARNTERGSKQEISKTRIKNWPNTLEALRVKREDDRIKKLEDEEVSIEIF